MALKRIHFSKKSTKIEICFATKPTREMCYYFTHSILVIHLRHLTENILRQHLQDTKTAGCQMKSQSLC